LLKPPIFLNWQQPCLEQVAALTLAPRTRAQRTGAEAEPPLDLSRKVMVFPGRRAIRRFREILLRQAEEQGLAFIPPSTVTVGALPERLMATRSVYASDPVRLMLWAQALQDLPKGLRLKLYPCQNEDFTTNSAILLAREIDTIFSELAGSRLTFADLQSAANQSEQLYTDSRWEVLDELLKLYQKKLLQHSLLDRDLHRETILRDKAFREAGEIYLVATVDLNPITRAFLELYPGEVTPLVYASEDYQDTFDAIGCLKEDVWLNREIDIPDIAISLLDRRSDEVAYISHLIESYQSEISTSDLTIGLADESQAGRIQAELARVGLDFHPPAGKPLTETEPYRILQTALEYLNSRSFKVLGNLIRSPDLSRALSTLSGQTGVGLEPVTTIDSYQFRHLQEEVASEIPEDSRYGSITRQILSGVEKLLLPLKQRADSLNQASCNITQFFLGIYQPIEDTFNSHELKERQETLAIFKRKLEEMLSSPVALTSFGTKEVASFLLQSVSTESLAATYEQEAIESLGWLELPLDDAGVVIVTGCQNEYLPQTINSHRFLPDAFRRQLGLRTNDARLARDSYVLTVLLNSKAKLHLLLSKTNDEGEFLSPSRLFFQCAPEKVLSRCGAFFSSEAPAMRAEIAPATFSGRSDDFEPVAPEPVADLNSVNISSLKDYLRCPFRYYLKQILKLKDVHDQKGELDALQFGTIAHDILTNFGRSKLINQSDDESAIIGFLISELDTVFEAQFGSNAAIAVQVQRETLKTRLIQFALNQIEWNRAGWVIKHVEYPLPDFALKLGDSEVFLRGRIDRIDYHPATKQWAVIDYKSGEKPQDPDRSYNKRAAQWLDLQLPLYSHILANSGFSGEIETTFWNLGSDSDGKDIYSKIWGTEELESALEETTRICTAIRAGEFWPPAKLRYNDEFSDLISQNVDYYDQEEEES